jgi:glycerol-3-phosphate dehydrogenase (NAD(P)+)
MSKVTVLGTGGWGIALALTAFNRGHQVSMWTCFEQEANELLEKRCSKKLLPDVKIPREISITTDLKAVEHGDFTILAVPSFAVRSTAAKLKHFDGGILISVAKGIEENTLLRLSQVIEEELPDRRIVILSGPSHAEEVAREIPTTVVVASKDAAAASAVQSALSGGYFRLYTHDDLLGVELGGALKNVIAVTAGIISGMGLGDNTMAALITRGLAEMARLGKAMGAEEKTFMGLTGLGDLVVTCTSKHSRNHRFGELVGKGVRVDEALEIVGTVEGYYAVRSAVKLAQRYAVEMPITQQCYAILYDGKKPDQALKDLMSRASASEQEKNLYF